MQRRISMAPTANTIMAMLTDGTSPAATAATAAAPAIASTPTSAQELIALLHLASPALPIGGFSYSQGFEGAVEDGFVFDEASALRWIRAGLETVIARCELPCIAQQMTRWQRYASELVAGTTPDDVGQAIADANAWFLASRESAELRQETEQMGWSLTSLSASLEWGHEASRALLASLKPVALPTAFAFATVAARAGVNASISAYAFNWVENQVAAALKAVPLGQLSGQRILWGLREAIASCAAHAATSAASSTASSVPSLVSSQSTVSPALTSSQATTSSTVSDALAGTHERHADIGAGLSTFAPLLGILSARHESQYSRLFRS